MAPKMASCHWKLFMLPSRVVKFIKINLHTLKQKLMNSNFQIMCPRTNEKLKWPGPYFWLLLSPFKNSHSPSHVVIFTLTLPQGGGGVVARWRNWLRHCATSRKVAGSIPDGVIGIFRWRNPSGRIGGLGSTQPTTEISTRNISRGKGGRCLGLANLPPSCADCLEVWEPQPTGTVGVSPGLYRNFFTFHYMYGVFRLTLSIWRSISQGMSRPIQALSAINLARSVRRWEGETCVCDEILQVCICGI